MSTILITGARGFIGRHLARALFESGQIVLGIGHGLCADQNESIAKWVNGDIDASNLDRLTDQSGPPQAVFHLAGGSSVGQSFETPLEDYRRTVDTTAGLLEWIRLRAPQSEMVLVSSAAVYGSGHAAPIAETAPLNPASPYGHHKLMAEELCRYYAAHFGLSVAITRLFSVYGPGLRRQLVWDICSRLDRGEYPVTLGGTGSELRDWIYVSDVVRLLMLLPSISSAQCPTVNGATGNGTSVRAMAEYLANTWGATAPKFSGIARLGDPPALVADTTRLAALGFSAQTAVLEGLEKTVEWFRSVR